MKILNHQKEQPKEKKVIVYALFILAVGILFMVFDGFTASKNQAQPVLSSKNDEEATPAFGKKKNTNPKTMLDYERQYENQLKELIQ